ncbi:hypothetical protein T484DRAFT_2541782 [Baffinella frigidus]|nr:hypothetical protein T484DRAFT_2541782 [Cryptophyta sp. CCMP2293]
MTSPEPSFMQSVLTLLNPPCGEQVFKAGYQNSRFAQQVQTYSCLYTSKVRPTPASTPARCLLLLLSCLYTSKCKATLASTPARSTPTSPRHWVRAGTGDTLTTHWRHTGDMTHWRHTH